LKTKDSHRFRGTGGMEDVLDCCHDELTSTQ
jgi:hypothetical protein